MYLLGPVKPHVQAAAEEIGSKFGVTTIHGFGQRDNASDHPLGLALDFMVYTDKAKGDAVAEYVIANWDRLGVKYLIWYQRIKNSATSPWETMANRGSKTANHIDHPHVSFKTKAGSGPVNDIGMPNLPGAGAMDAATDALGKLGNALSFLTDSKNWLRMVFMWGGAWLLIMGIVILGRQNSGP